MSGPWCMLLMAFFVGACGSERPVTASVVGRITDASGQVIPDAVVVVGDGPTRRAAVTGTSGTYSFDGLSPGQVSVHVFAPGVIYDAGHGLRPFMPGKTTYNVSLRANPPSLGPTFVGIPTVSRSANRIHLSIDMEPGPGSPVGSELLAVDASDDIGVLLHRGPSGVASGEVPVPASGPTVEWRFLATDDACQSSTSFPTARLGG